MKIKVIKEVVKKDPSLKQGVRVNLLVSELHGVFENTVARLNFMSSSPVSQCNGKNLIYAGS